VKVHRITLTNFKGVAEATVTFADEGVTIVEGDNEAGKSTLIEALDLLLNEKSTSKRASVVATKPIGQDVGPQAEAELTIGTQRVTIRKRWLKGQETVFTLHGTPDEVVTGGDGHDRLDALMSAHVDRQLLTALQVLQGTKLNQANLQNTALSTALDAAGGVDASGQIEDSLWQRIREERERYWTAGGQKRQERKQLDEKIADAERSRDTLAATLQGLESDVASVARLRRDAADRAARIGELTPELEQLTQRMTTIDNLLGDRATAVLGQQQAQLQASQVEDRLATRKGLLDKVSSREATLASLEADNTSSSGQQRLAEEADGAKSRRDVARAEVQHRQSVKEHADLDERLRRDLFDLEILEERLERYERAQQDLNAADAVLRSHKIDAELLEEIEDVYVLHLQTSGAALDQAVQVELDALIAADISGVDLDLQVDAGSTTHLDLVSTTEINVPGAARIVITPGRDVGELQAQRMDAAAKLERLLAQAGVPDVPAARLASQACQDATTRAEAAAKDIREALRDLSHESLSGHVTHLRTDTAKRIEARPEDPPLPPDIATAEAKHAEAAESELSAANDRLVESRSAAAQHLIRVEQAQGELARAHEDLAAAQQANPDADLHEDQRRAAADRASADEKLKRLDEQLRDLDAESTRVLHENSAGAIQRARSEQQELERDLRDLELKLEIRGEQGLASQLDELERSLDELLSERQRIDARADAAQLLHQTFDTHRTAAQVRYRAPLKAEIERLGKIVFGEDLSVTLDDDLTITERTLDGMTVPFDQLSIGAQEQLGVLARLACAALVGDEGGAPVILDDALGWSDPGRLGRMGAALNIAGRTSQVIVLTCFPDRYAAVGNAEVVRLTS
jgi:chromosome segregation ATPase